MASKYRGTCDGVVSEEEAAQTDLVYLVLWPKGHEHEPGVVPKLRALGPPPPGPKYAQYVLRRARSNAESGVTREEFYAWMDALGLELVRFSSGIYLPRWNRKARRTPAEEIRAWMWT